MGCGTAGPVSATLLARQGHDVTLYERAEVCRPVGAGFILQPSGMRVLRELGVADRVASQGAPIRRLHAIDLDRGPLLDLRYDELDPTECGTGLRRPVMLEALLEAAAGAGVMVRWGWEAAEMRRGDDWREVISTTGESSGRCDLVVICDGTRSLLRKKAGFHGRDRGYPWGAYLFIGEGGGHFPEDELYQVVRGTGKLLCFVPTGPDPATGRPLSSLFWSVRLDRDAINRAGPLDRWKDSAVEMYPQSAHFFSRITDWSQVLTGRYGDVRMQRWHGEGVVILGDAGHAMSPQLGQGINLALADAACLASCVERLPLEEALPAYTRGRRLALSYYQFSTCGITPFFQSDLEWLAPWRHFFFNLSGRIRPLRRLMVQTMAG